jgi:hypothetical protein
LQLPSAPPLPPGGARLRRDAEPSSSRRRGTEDAELRSAVRGLRPLRPRPTSAAPRGVPFQRAAEVPFSLAAGSAGCARGRGRTNAGGAGGASQGLSTSGHRIAERGRQAGFGRCQGDALGWLGGREALRNVPNRGAAAELTVTVGVVHQAEAGSCLGRSGGPASGEHPRWAGGVGGSQATGPEGERSLHPACRAPAPAACESDWHASCSSIDSAGPGQQIVRRNEPCSTPTPMIAEVGARETGGLLRGRSRSGFASTLGSTDRMMVPTSGSTRTARLWRFGAYATLRAGRN